MKRWLLGSVIALGTAFAMAATPAMAAKTLVYCSEGSPDSLNPSLTTSGTSFDAALPVYETLVAFQPGGTAIVPALAEAWTVSPDGLSYTFSLRRDVKIHNAPGFTPSRTLNADDVIFSFQRQWRTDHPFHKVSGGSYDYFNDLGMSALLKTVEKVDDYTVRFTLNRVEAPFLANLAMPFTAILSAEYADAMAKSGTPEKIDQFPVGTGPFQFVTYQKDAAVRYKAFADYWGGRQPLDNLVFAITPDPEIRIAKLKAGECHVAAFPNPADIPTLRNDRRVTMLEQEGLTIGYLAFQTTRKPFDDERVRHAIAMAIDKKAIVHAIYQGAGVTAKNPIPPSMWSYNETIKDIPYDPVKARDMLEEAGYRGGFDTELWAMPVQRPYNPNARGMAEMIQADLSHIGIRVTIKTLEWGEYLKRIQAGDHQMALMGWISDNGDPDNFLHSLLGCDAARVGGSNIAKWCNREFNDLVVRAKQTTDVAERTKLYREAQVVFHAAQPWVPLAHSMVFVAMSPKVRNYHKDPFGLQHFGGVDLAN